MLIARFRPFMLFFSIKDFSTRLLKLRRLYSKGRKNGTTNKGLLVFTNVLPKTPAILVLLSPKKLPSAAVFSNSLLFLSSHINQTTAWAAAVHILLTFFFGYTPLHCEMHDINQAYPDRVCVWFFLFFVVVGGWGGQKQIILKVLCLKQMHYSI